MYPFDPALHSFPRETDLEILWRVSLRGRVVSRQRQSNRGDYRLQSLQSYSAITSRLDLKSLEITVDLFSCSFLFSLKKKIKNAQNDQLTRHTKCGKRGNERLDWGTLKPEVDHNTDMRTVHILTIVNTVVTWLFSYFFRFLLYYYS